MTPAEASYLLGKISVFDNRKADESGEVAAMWADALREYPLADCLAAVREHFRDSTEYLAPAHVRTIVKRIRAKRIAEHPILTPPPNLTVLETNEWLKKARKHIGDGGTVDSDAAYGELKPRNMGDLRALMPKAPDE